MHAFIFQHVGFDDEARSSHSRCLILRPENLWFAARSSSCMDEEDDDLADLLISL